MYAFSAWFSAVRVCFECCVNEWRLCVCYLTMSLTALFVMAMCYNLFIYLTEREQLILRTTGGKHGGGGGKQRSPVLLYFKNCSVLLWQLIFLK